MKILQLSDYHFSNNSTSKSLGRKIISQLGEKVKEKFTDQIDFIFFTGDLVYNGKHNNFKEAYSSLIQELNSFLDIPEENIIISCGNHDVNWEKVQKSIEVLFENEIKNDEDLNDFITNNDLDYKASLRPLENFNDFISTKKYADYDIIKPLFTTHKRKVGGKTVGIATINTAWRSSSSTDYGQLLFPTMLLDEIEEDLKESDLRLLLFHHPISWFKEFNQESLRNRIYNFFNIGFCGHEHQNQISSHHLHNEGILINQNPACLTFEKGRSVGLTLLEYDFNNDYEIFITPLQYSKEEKAFFKSDTINSVIPHGKQKAEQNKIRQKIKSKLSLEISNANDLILYEGESEVPFKDLFSKPSLKTTPKSQMSEENLNEWFDFEDLHKTDENYLILGPDKCGKTSILKKLQIDFLEIFPNKSIVPFYIDYKELEAKSGASLDLLKHIRDYFEINLSDTKTILSNYQFIFLLDNFLNDHFITERISNLLEDYPDIKFIICGKETSYNIVDGFGIKNLNYRKLFIHDLKRKQIRKFSNRWEISDQQDYLLDRIVTVCKQLELPLNYWTASLLLLIHKKTSVDASKNLFEILDLCIEEVLNKKRLVLSQQKLNFDTIKNLCSRLAHELLINYSYQNYSTTYKEILNFLDNIISENPRISAEAKEVLDYLINTGVLKQKETGLITFRLNGFFEFFLAKYLTQEESFKKEILEDDQLYLSFKNELELYSGFKRDDEDFLSTIFKKTKNGVKPLHDAYSNTSTVDEILSEKVTLIQGIKETAKKFQDIEPLSHDEQDTLIEQNSSIEIHSDVHKKKLYDQDTTPETVERYLQILSRVLKNSINVGNYELMYNIFDYLLESYIYFGFYLIDEIKSNEFGDLNKFKVSDRHVNILNVISSFIPVIIQVDLFEGLGNHSVISIIERKIELLKKNPKENQYSLFLLYFLLFDIDLEGQKEKIDEILDIISIGVLKTSILVKLNYYLAFKAYKKPQLERFISRKIRKANNLIQGNKNSRGLNKELGEKSRKNIVKRSSRDNN